ncbi:MAG: sugar transferase [Burkholderiales bacterium]|nr:sugar transferase [Burkholderiales bacterium]
MAKRLFDLLCAAAGLVLLAPLLLGIALWIKLDTPGPVFFRQQRVGRFGAPFWIHKFRSMRADAARNGAQDDAQDDAPGGDHGGPQITVGADPRITRAGRFLRRTKLDELPQLLDVLVGSMSLVGPRPEVPRYVALYPAALRDKVLSVRPGITDPASIAYRDESTLLAQAADPERVYIEQVMPAKLRCAAEYVERMSLANDLRLIGATLRSLWTH